ncbi:MAG: hypothetical protein BRC43_12830, partial [Cyanobacteria bacterium QS_3_48_167]
VQNDTKDYVISSITGLFTGGPLGLIASPFSLKLFANVSKTDRGKWIKWALAGLIGSPLCLGITAGFLPSEETSQMAQESSSETESGSQGKATSTSPGANGVGDQVEVSGRAIRVDNVQITDFLGINNSYYENIPTKGKFVVIDMTWWNTSNETGDMLWSSFTLKDSKGREYGEIDGSDRDAFYRYEEENGYGSMDDSLFPGGSAKDGVVFEVPPNATDFTLVWKGKEINLGK